MAPGLEKSAIWSIWEDNISVLLAWCVSGQTSCFSLPIKNLLKGQTRIHVFVLGGGERGLWIVLLYIHYYFMLFLYSVNVDSLQNVVSVVLCSWKIFSQWFCAICVPFFPYISNFFCQEWVVLKEERPVWRRMQKATSRKYCFDKVGNSTLLSLYVFISVSR